MGYKQIRKFYRKVVIHEFMSDLIVQYLENINCYKVNMGKSSAVSLQLVYPKYDLVAESNVGHWPALFLNQDFLFFFLCVCVSQLI